MKNIRLTIGAVALVLATGSFSFSADLNTAVTASETATPPSNETINGHVIEIITVT